MVIGHYNWGVNFAGRVFGKYAKWNAPAHLKMARMVLKEVISQLKPVFASAAAGGTGQTVAIAAPQQCNRPEATLTFVEKRKSWWQNWVHLTYRAGQNPADEFTRLIATLTEGHNTHVNDHRRQAVRCIMAQLDLILTANSGTNAGAAETMFQGTIRHLNFLSLRLALAHRTAHTQMVQTHAAMRSARMALNKDKTPSMASGFLLSFFSPKAAPKHEAATSSAHTL